MVVEVIINRTGKKLDRTFDYNVPDDLVELIHIGAKVYVIFGNGKTETEAFVTKIKEKSNYTVKDIVKVQTSLDDKQMQLAKWMHKKYFTSLATCISLMLSPGTKNKNEEKRIKEKTVNLVCLNENKSKEKITPKQEKVIEYFQNNKGKLSITELEKKTGVSKSVINTLIKNGYLLISEERISRNPIQNKNIKKTDFLTFTDEQEIAYNEIAKSIDENVYNKFLIHGVTGSGKTEIYLQLIKKVFESGRQSIMLVPEISLTPQMLDRFISRFGKEEIAVIHSKLSMGEKFDEWDRIKNGKAKIIIGARSAIFSPTNNLGLIIVDEEHDSSYKSESNPRYNAKEVAKYRAKEEKIPLVFGSATPDICTYYKTKNVLNLTKRANDSKLPKVEIIDLKRELASGNRSMFSNELYSKIQENIKNKHQTILFLNRRGFSTFVMCRECGDVVKCKNCNISLTYHSYQNKLRCHYCGYEKNMVTICPECNSEKIKYFGTGTQKLEEEINKQFPDAKTIRMDIDTVTKKNSHEEILNRFKKENMDILIGTQMVVKGHHFPNVTLVGVMAADSMQNIDDYRGNEKCFQILTQVAGRAGRDKLEGNVIIQTYNPHDFAIKCAKEHDFNKFYETEISLRRQLKYPPFCDIIVVGFSSNNEKELLKTTNNVYEYLKERLEQNFNVFKPMPCPIDKIQNRLRWRMIIKGNMTKQANNVLNQCMDIIYKNLKHTNISIDVNPNNMM